MRRDGEIEPQFPIKRKKNIFAIALDRDLALKTQANFVVWRERFLANSSGFP